MKTPNLKESWTIVKKAASNWSDDHATTMSAALSYYTIFAIAPLILIAVAVSGLFFGQEASSGEIYSSMSSLFGDDGAKAVQSFVEASALKKTGIIATIVGVATLIVGATTVFGQLQDSLNTIWKVKQQSGRAIWNVIRQRLLSFSLILVIAFLLLVSLIAGAALAAIGAYAKGRLPGGEVVWQVLNFVFSFGMTTVLFAAIYKILPDVKLEWKDVWVGGFVTAFFFTVGKSLIGIYLGKSGVTSTYGAAGSAVLILVWTYYSSAILFFGAEITKVYSSHHLGKQHLDLKKGAEWATPERPRQQSFNKPSFS